MICPCSGHHLSLLPGFFSSSDFSSGHQPGDPATSRASLSVPWPREEGYSVTVPLLLSVLGTPEPNPKSPSHYIYPPCHRNLPLRFWCASSHGPSAFSLTVKQCFHCSAFLQSWRFQAIPHTATTELWNPSLASPNPLCTNIYISPQLIEVKGNLSDKVSR